MHILHIHCIYIFYVQHKELYTGHSMWTCIYTHYDYIIQYSLSIYIYVYIHIDTNNMDLTVHCICTGGIHIFHVLNWMYFLCPNSNRPVCALNFTVWRKKSNVLQ